VVPALFRLSRPVLYTIMLFGPECAAMHVYVLLMLNNNINESACMNHDVGAVALAHTCFLVVYRSWKAQVSDRKASNNIKCAISQFWGVTREHTRSIRATSDELCDHDRVD
jgi:hypothetical protein